MVSRAYHDSLFMSRIAPAAMLFIPCRTGTAIALTSTPLLKTLRGERWFWPKRWQLVRLRRSTGSMSLQLRHMRNIHFAIGPMLDDVRTTLSPTDCAASSDGM